MNEGNITFDNRDVSGGNYTVVFNAVFRDTALTPEAVGIYCMMCYAPPWFQASADKLCETCECGRSKMQRILNELISNGYITRTHDKDPETGEYTGYTYKMHRDPKSLIETAPPQETEKLQEKAEKPKKKAEKHKYGEYKHVMLTDAEYNKLVANHGEVLIKEAIHILDEGIEMKGYKYKSHNLVLQKWPLEEAKKTLRKGNNKPAKTYAKNTNPFMEMLEGGF